MWANLRTECKYAGLIVHVRYGGYEGIEPPSWVLGDEVIAAGAKGILFKSAITGGTNIALYNDALAGFESIKVRGPHQTLPKIKIPGISCSKPGLNSENRAVPLARLNSIAKQLKRINGIGRCGLAQNHRALPQSIITFPIISCEKKLNASKYPALTPA